eukprot:1141515-Pelagomonas_calceolata.AAC.3
MTDLQDSGPSEQQSVFCRQTLEHNLSWRPHGAGLLIHVAGSLLSLHKQANSDAVGEIRTARANSPRNYGLAQCQVDCNLVLAGRFMFATIQQSDSE